MHIGLWRATAIAAFLGCVVCGPVGAGAGTYRSVSASGWTNATHRSVSRLPARRGLSGQRIARAPWHSPNGPRGLSRAAPPIQKAPGATVLNRHFLDDVNATTLRDALHYVPGVIGR
jgi:hypothetical protein